MSYPIHAPRRTLHNSSAFVSIMLTNQSAARIKVRPHRESRTRHNAAPTGADSSSVHRAFAVEAGPGHDRGGIPPPSHRPTADPPDELDTSTRRLSWISAECSS